MRATLAGSAIAALVAGISGGTPAGAATTGATTVTFGVTAGALNISAPVSVALGPVAGGTNATGQLGTVTVNDQRGSLLAAWVATASSTTFTTTGSGAPVIPLANVSYWSGPATATTGIVPPVPGQPLAANAVVLTSPQTAFSLTAGVGSNSAAWNPTLIVAVPNTAVAGTYTGTITHSVA